MTLAQLRAALAEKIKGLSALRDKAFGDEATEADTTALKTAMDEIKALEAKIETAKEVDDAIKRAALPVDETEGTQQQRSSAQVAGKLTTVQKLGLTLTATIMAHRNHSTPQKELEDNGYGTVIKELITTTPSAGGVAVPTPLENEIIEILHEDSAFLAGNPRELDLPNGNTTIPAGDTGVTGGYGAEATDISVEQQTFRDVNLAAKRLSVIVPASNELLSWSIGGMQAFIEDDIRGALGEQMDLNLLRGDGQSNRPLGITKIVGVPSFAALSATGTQAQIIAAVESTLARAEWEMRQRKIKGRRAGWLMSPRIRIWLSGLRDGNGNRVYPELNYGPDMGGARLRNKPVFETTEIPDNLGTSGTDTEIALIDYSHVLFGKATGLTFAVSQEASYKVSGTMYSAFQRNVTLIRGMMHHDADIRHLGAVVNITDVDWGATL